MWVQSLLLVGGFAASDWLYGEIRAALEDQGIEVYRPDSHVSVLSFYLVPTWTDWFAK